MAFSNALQQQVCDTVATSEPKKWTHNGTTPMELKAIVPAREGLCWIATMLCIMLFKLAAADLTG